MKTTDNSKKLDKNKSLRLIIYKEIAYYESNFSSRLETGKRIE